jgi:galactokinase/galacturonokinase
VGIARATYRVCPLGAHTDHQRGFVIGFALNRALHAFFRRREDRLVRVSSREFQNEVVFEIGTASGAEDPSFGGYLRGIAARLDTRRKLERGVEAWVEGDLLPGGIGSSAALQVAFLLLLASVNGMRLERAEAMQLVVCAEQEGAGVAVGLLDPAVILFGEKDHLVYLDCADGVPRVQKLAASLPPFEIVLLDSGVTRDLRTSPYNDRVAECRAAARALGATGASAARWIPCVPAAPSTS